MSKNRNGIDKITKTVIYMSIRLIIYALLILLIIKVAAMSYSFGHDIFYASSVEEAPGRDISLTVTEDMGAKEAAVLLKSKGLINNELSFEIQSRFFDLDIIPGDYTLNTSQTSRQILEILDKGPLAEEGKTEKQSR